MKILQPIFGILVALTKNELTKICNEPGISELNATYAWPLIRKPKCELSKFHTNQNPIWVPLACVHWASLLKHFIFCNFMEWSINILRSPWFGVEIFAAYLLQQVAFMSEMLSSSEMAVDFRVIQELLLGSYYTYWSYYKYSSNQITKNMNQNLMLVFPNLTGMTYLFLARMLLHNLKVL